MKKSLLLIDAHTRIQLIMALMYVKLKLSNKNFKELILLSGMPNGKKLSSVGLDNYCKEQNWTFRHINRGALNRERIEDYDDIDIVTSVNFPVEAFLYALRKTNKIPALHKTEEGVGSYAGYRANILLGSKAYQYKIQGVAKVIVSFTFLPIIWKIFGGKKYRILDDLNEDSIIAFKQVIQSIGRNAQLETSKNKILLESIVSSDIKIPEDEFIVKRHPHFSTSSVSENSKIDSYTVEEIVYANNITQVVGSNSSSLVYSSALLGIETLNFAGKNYPDKKVSLLFKKFSKSFNY